MCTSKFYYLKTYLKKTLVNYKAHFGLLKIVQQKAVASHSFASWESFLSNSKHFYELAAPIRAEISVFHAFRLLHYTSPLHARMGLCCLFMLWLDMADRAGRIFS